MTTTQTTSKTAAPVKEEQNEMFPKVKSSSLDLVALGARMAARKEDLLALAA